MNSCGVIVMKPKHPGEKGGGGDAKCHFSMQEFKEVRTLSEIYMLQVWHVNTRREPDKKASRVSKHQQEPKLGTHRRLTRTRRACRGPTSTSLCAPRTTSCRQRSSLTKGRAAMTGTWRPSVREQKTKCQKPSLLQGRQHHQVSISLTSS